VADEAPGVIRQVPWTFGADRSKIASPRLNCGGFARTALPIGGLGSAAAQALATESPPPITTGWPSSRKQGARTAGIPETRLGVCQVTATANVFAENQQAMPSLTTYLIELF
jgi:hypothetical protein